jgi:hypothetical protein
MDAAARCATPEGIALVDAAFDRPGGPAQRRMETDVCPTCQVWDDCLKAALATGEHGPWGGTSERKRRQFVRHPPMFNLRTAHMPAQPTTDDGQRRRSAGGGSNRRLIRELGLNASDVKQWALTTGRATTVPRGTPSAALIQEYANAHPKETP